MKKGTIILIMLFIFCSGVMAQSAGQSKYLRPTNFQEKVSIKVSGKSRTYYALSPEKGAIINIQGPGKLRVLTRAQFKFSTAKEISYEIQYTIDGAEQHIIELDNAEPSTIADYNDATIGTPGELKDFEIVLRRGYHNIEFILMEDKIPVAARYNFMPTKEKKQEWIAFCPLKPSEPVDLVSRESTVNYYRFSKEKPLRVEINGPTELRVLTRIENHYQMKGRIHYRVQVKENDNIISTYQLSSQRSEIAVYKYDNELIPGKACEFVIDIPKGRHIYEISPLDRDKNSLLGRCLLPKKDVKLVN